MDASAKLHAAKPLTAKNLTRPTREEAEEAVRTLIAWAGDDPSREGLLDTPRRVTKAYKEFFAGYEEDPKAILSKTFKEVGGYDDIVMVKDIPFASHCEHHMVPFVGKAHVAYIPDGRVVGLSKLARVVDVYAVRDATAGETPPPPELVLSGVTVAEDVKAGGGTFGGSASKAGIALIVDGDDVASLIDAMAHGDVYVAQVPGGAANGSSANAGSP